MLASWSIQQEYGGRENREERDTLFIEGFGEGVVRVVGEGPAEARRHRRAFHVGEHLKFVCIAGMLLFLKCCPSLEACLGDNLDGGVYAKLFTCRAPAMTTCS